MDKQEIIQLFTDELIDVETLIDIYLGEHAQVLAFRDAQTNMNEWLARLEKFSNKLEWYDEAADARNSELGHVIGTLVEKDAVKRFEATREYIYRYLSLNDETYMKTEDVLNVPVPNEDNLITSWRDSHGR